MDPAPPPRPCPAFDRWLNERKIKYREAAAPLGCSHETVRLICLPFDDPARRVPSKDLMERIWRWTAGEVRPRDFYPFGHEAAVADVAA